MILTGPTPMLDYSQSLDLYTTVSVLSSSTKLFSIEATRTLLHELRPLNPLPDLPFIPQPRLALERLMQSLPKIVIAKRIALAKIEELCQSKITVSPAFIHLCTGTQQRSGEGEMMYLCRLR